MSEEAVIKRIKVYKELGLNPVNLARYLAELQGYIPPENLTPCSTEV